jgi:enoyl-CoA hydratase
VSDQVLLVAVHDHVATLTLNRPAARNALNGELRDALWDAVTEAAADDAVDVIVLTGSDPAFCAGIDLKELPPEGAPTTSGTRRGPDGLFRFLPATDKPIIGAINGACVTGGLEVALQCTFLLASDRARFADTHGRVGVLPGGGMTVLLPQAVGLRKAIELSLTGNPIDAQEALRLGLVNAVVPHEKLLPTAHGLARDMVRTGRPVVRRLLEQYRRVAAAASAAEAHALEGLMAETWLLARGRQQDLS